LPLKVITFRGIYLAAFTIAIKATLETSIFVAFSIAGKDNNCHSIIVTP